MTTTRMKTRELGELAGATQGMVHVAFHASDVDGITQTVNNCIFICNQPYRLVSVKAAYGSEGGADCWMRIVKCASTTTIANGTDLLSAALNLSTTSANVVKDGILIKLSGTSSVMQKLEFADGDRLGLIVSGTMTGLSGLNIECMMLPIGDKLFQIDRL